VHISNDTQKNYNGYHSYHSYRPTVEGVQLSNTTETANFEIVIDSKLRFDKHITSVSVVSKSTVNSSFDQELFQI